MLNCLRRARCLLLLVPVLSLCVPSAHAQAGLPSNEAAMPQDRLSENWWAERHAAVLEQVKAHPDAQLLMIGDSITNNYDKSKLPDENFQPTWQTFYATRGALNLGYSGDTTSNVLWRLAHGEVEGLHPKVAVVLIGTNNTGVKKQTAEQAEVGIDAVVLDLEKRLPDTKILLMGILPSGLSTEKSAADAAVNHYLAAVYGENPRVTYMDVGSIFMRNGALDADIFYDPRLPGHPAPLHPDTKSQRWMAEAIEPTLAKLMGDAPAVPLSSMTEINNALIPTERLELDSYDWYARHHAVMELQRTLRPRVVLIGDSITNFWSGAPLSSRVNGPQSWQDVFGAMPVLNMGFGWDRVQNVLWRMRQGEFEGLAPSYVVINIGTNNIPASSNARANTPGEIADGISAIVNEVQRRSSTSHIILMKVFPRGAKPNNPMREPIRQVNALLQQRYGAQAGITLGDLTDKFVQSDGTIPKSLMDDGTHPTEAGYRFWADALKQIFAGEAGSHTAPLAEDASPHKTVAELAAQ